MDLLGEKSLDSFDESWLVKDLVSQKPANEMDKADMGYANVSRRRLNMRKSTAKKEAVFQGRTGSRTWKGTARAWNHATWLKPWMLRIDGILLLLPSVAWKF